MCGLLVDYTARNNCTSYHGIEVRAAGNADNSLLIRVKPFVSLYHPDVILACISFSVLSRLLHNSYSARISP